jgi:hypothetical protein
VADPSFFDLAQSGKPKARVAVKFTSVSLGYAIGFAMDELVVFPTLQVLEST